MLGVFHSRSLALCEALILAFSRSRTLSLSHSWSLRPSHSHTLPVCPSRTLSLSHPRTCAIYDSALFCTLARSFSNFLNAVDVVNIASGLAFHVLHAYHVFVM